MQRLVETNRICKQCVHFRKNPKFWSFGHNAVVFGKCQKFGKTDLVTGEVELAFASICRENEALCGAKGALFEPREK